MSEDPMALFEEIKNRKPRRLGEFLGEENNLFYVAISEEEIYELSPLAYYVWMICDGEHTVEELLNRMSKDVDVDQKELVEPLVYALDRLIKAKLVEYIS